MNPSPWLRTAAAAAVAVPVALVATASPGAAQEPTWTAQSLTPTERVDVIKAPTSRLAQTDESLLDLTSSEPIPVVVKLDHDPLATYAGGVPGYAATSPAVTGEPLDGDVAERRYESYLAQREASFVASLAKAIPEAEVGQSLRTVYGGVAVTLPANRVRDLLKVDGVAAVQRDELRQPLTDSSPAFIGADTLYAQLGGTADAGKGTTIGVIDTGAWPEHPSFADLGNLDPWPGPPLECEFGPDPTDPSGEPFECNNKLVGGYNFLDTYHAVEGDEQFPFTARDDNGHGTHTMSTAAGNVLDSAPLMGADHGPVNGIAPGAWVIMYRACGPQGCFSSDTAAAVGQAIQDGVDVINYSISGGTNPFTDPTELAFLDAFAAGVFVSASAGNDGPGAATVNHVSPWVTTVAASTQEREFRSTLTLTADNGDTFEVQGTSVTGGAGPAPVVMAADPPYNDPLCQSPAPVGIFEGVIVACERGVNARVEKGFNVLQGGAEGMILFNPNLQGTSADNHWLPAIHLADGTDFVAFMTSHTGVTGSFTDGQKVAGQGDVIADFSSRGPGGLGLKPDIAAPGVQILAGNIPIAGDPAAGGGPAGEFFQAIQGTSMAAPHVAGAALLLRALHPDWSPAQIKSALMTTAVQDMVKEDLTTPADPFDYGSGRLDLTVAGSVGLTLDETAENMAALGGDPVNAVHLNLPSINAPVMPGELTTTRTVTNVTNRALTYKIEVDSPADSRIRVTPSQVTVPPGKSKQLRITITSSAPEQQLFGEIRLVPTRKGLPTQHLPVAFVHKQGGVSLSSTCTPDSIKWFGTSTCTVVATNHSFVEQTVDLATTTEVNLPVIDVDGAKWKTPFQVKLDNVTLSPAVPGTPSLSPGSNPAGEWLPLSLFGIAPIAVGDETLINFNTPPYVYGGQVFTQLGVTSNGYVVAGPASGEDVEFDPPGIPNPARPNNVLAPFWTDLTGEGSTGIRAATLTDGVDTWIVIEWQLNPWGMVDNEQMFQVWIGINGVEDISFAYNPLDLPSSPHNLVVGAEDVAGLTGDSLGFNVPPTGDLVVTSADPVPGGSVTYEVTVLGLLPGTGTVTSTMVGDGLPGTTVVTSEVEVGLRLK
ncbi:MAG: S8 family serine peptidase [Micromonosporaceae bacterium]